MYGLFGALVHFVNLKYGSLALWGWALWGVLLIVQSFSFTYVSRARSSGSLWRHLKASIFSNGVWFLGQMMIFSTFMQILTGKFGFGLAVVAALFYTALSVTGSLTAHAWALRTERGKNAVGANKKYAQIPIEEWERVKSTLGIN